MMIFGKLANGSDVGFGTCTGAGAGAVTGELGKADSLANADC